MKELRISEDGVTFSSALKRIKSVSPAVKPLPVALRDSWARIPKVMSNGHMASPKVRITERKNLTLRQLYQQFQQDPRNEYVIRLKHDYLMRDSSNKSFDNWLETLKPNSIKISPKVNLALKSQQNTKSFSDKIVRQIYSNLPNIGNKLTKKQTQTTQQSLNSQLYSLQTQTNYSFANYFSQHSDLQPTKISPQLQTITKVSLKSSQPTCEDQVIRDDVNSEEKRVQNIYQCYIQAKDKNKQNLSPNVNIAHGPEGKIVGLQFSKNRRFKSTKRKKRAQK